jgi:hypothetical protein
MSYQDLILAFVPAADSERYHIITHSPAEGQIVASFVSPFGEERINTWRHGLNPSEIRLIGSLLYRRVFSPDIHRAFDACRRFAQRQGLALRVKLILDAVLSQLPWEFLYEPEANQFLALDQRVAIVRYFDLPLPRSSSRYANGLRLSLFVPDDVAALEHQPLMALAGQPDAQIHVLTLDEIENSAKNFLNLQVLHLQAASGRDPASGHYALRIGENAGTRWLTEDAVARWLRANASIQLVVLDASQGSDATTREASALAANLVERGVVPSAVALQFPLGSVLRAEFLKTFYHALANNDGLDLAMTEARRAIAAIGGTWEWGAPVLYSALRDDQPRLEPQQRHTKALLPNVPINVRQ